MKTFANTYRTTRNLWAMRLMSASNGNPTVAKAMLVGITAANFGIGLWSVNRLEKKGRTTTAKIFKTLNYSSLFINVIDNVKIAKEIDILAGKDKKQVKVKESTFSGPRLIIIEDVGEEKFKLPSSGLAIGIKAPTLSDFLDIARELKAGNWNHVSLGCEDGSCMVCQAFKELEDQPKTEETTQEANASVNQDDNPSPVERCAHHQEFGWCKCSRPNVDMDLTLGQIDPKKS